MVAVRGLEQVLLLTRIISAIFVIAVILVSVSYARKRIELNEAITGLMLTYVVFAPVTNEQLLAALVPIGLISRNFSHKLTIFPLLYIAFNSTYHYFAIPIFFSSQELRTVWESFNALWGLMVKDYQLQLRYLFGVGLGLSAFWLLSDTKHIPRTVLKLGVTSRSKNTYPKPLKRVETPHPSKEPSLLRKTSYYREMMKTKVPLIHRKAELFLFAMVTSYAAFLLYYTLSTTPSCPIC
jgi:hypothetical protein